MTATLYQIRALERRTRTTDRDVDTGLVERLSALTEDRVLDWLWQMVRRTDDRLWVLLQLTAVSISRPPSWDRVAIRRAHGESCRGHGVVKLTYHRCFGCGSSETLYAHHAVEIQNGGSNAPRNKVPLCFDCHQYLHPWLEEPQRRGAKGLESVGDIATRAVEPVVQL